MKKVLTLFVALLFATVAVGQTTLPIRGITMEEPAPYPMAVSRISAVYAAAGAAGGITLYYWVATTYAIGTMFPVGPVVVANTAALGGANTVTLNWPTMAGATSYTVVRTLTPQFPTAGACVACALVVVAPTTTLLDNGAVLVAAFQTSGVNKATRTLTLDDRDWSSPMVEFDGQLGVNVRWDTVPVPAQGAFTAFRSSGGVQTTGGHAFGISRIATNTSDEFTYGLDLYGGVAAGGDGVTTSIRGQNQSQYENETANLWTSNSEIRVAGLADTWLDADAWTTATIYGFRSRILTDLAAPVAVAYGGHFNAQTDVAAGGGVVIGARGNAYQIAGVTGTDILTGVYGESNPQDGLVGGTYGTFGLLNIGGTTTAGVNWMAAGAKGDYEDHVGIDVATTYTAGVMGYVSNLDTVGPDGAVVAVLGGGDVRTAANPSPAAFRVIDLDDTAGVNFDYGFDAYWTDGALLDTTFNEADIRGSARTTMKNDVAAIWTVTDEADTVLGTENLSFPADFSNVAWAVAAEFAVAGTFATYTFAVTGAGTVTQLAAALAVGGIGNQWYRLDYTISAAPTVVDAVLTLTNAFGLAAVPMPIIAGANTVYFESAVAPTNVVFNVAGATAGVFTIEQASIRQVQSGNIVTRGPIRATAVTFADLPAAVNGTMIYCVDCNQAAAGAGPLVCASTPGTGAMAFRVAGAWTCLGI